MSSGTTVATTTPTAERHDDFVRLALRLRGEGAVAVRDGGMEARWSGPPQEASSEELPPHHALNAMERKELDELRVLRERYEELP